MAVNDDEERRGPFGTARALLGKVVDKVVDAAFGAEPQASAPAAVAKASPTGDREPIPTRTMAGLLVAQGHEERALAIYDHLIEDQPDDAGLRSEAEAVRSALTSRGAAIPRGDREDEGRGAGDDAGPKVVAVAAGRERLLLSWRLTDESLDRARRILGAPGEVRVRVMVTAADPTEVVSTATIERRGVEGAGEWVMTAPRGALCTAAVGVAEGERFVSAAHAPTVAV